VPFSLLILFPSHSIQICPTVLSNPLIFVKELFFRCISSFSFYLSQKRRCFSHFYLLFYSCSKLLAERGQPQFRGCRSNLCPWGSPAIAPKTVRNPLCFFLPPHFLLIKGHTMLHGNLIISIFYESFKSFLKKSHIFCLLPVFSPICVAFLFYFYMFVYQNKSLPCGGSKRLFSLRHPTLFAQAMAASARAVFS
jgi:hypothetical protein